jgi:peptide-methionine (S)-S-oxide reductase
MRTLIFLVLTLMHTWLYAAPTPAAPAGMEKATFAGGCFWCMEQPFHHLEGVLSATSGYTGGSVADPGYHAVSAGGTGHTESVEVIFDPKKISYEKLLDLFWHNIDPLAKDQQFCDIGSQYRSAIFFHSKAQQAQAQASLVTIAKQLGNRKAVGKIETEITLAGPFYAAEDYHQNYAEKNPIRYRYYRGGCGRDNRLKAIWGEAAGAH